MARSVSRRERVAENESLSASEVCFCVSFSLWISAFALLNESISRALHVAFEVIFQLGKADGIG